MKGARLVLGFPDYAAPASRLADRAGLPYEEVEIHRFPDGESRVRLPPALPAEVILCRSLDDANGKLVELELAAATALELGARTLTLVAPYLCYMRQDSAFRPGEAVSQRIIGEWLARRFDALITVDPHLHRTHRLADAVPVRRALALSAAEPMARWLSQRGEAPMLLGPDEESRQWVEAIAAPAGLESGVASKRRLGDREVQIELPKADFAGRAVVLVDDVASSGMTLAETARRLAALGAGPIDVLVTHALLVGDARGQLVSAGVREIASTDSVADASNQVQLDQLLAAALSDP